MNIAKILKNFVFFGCTIYTVLSAGILIFIDLLSYTESQMPDVGRFLSLLAFSFILSVGSTVLRIDTINRLAACAVHAACYIIGFFIFMMLCQIQFASAIIATAVFAVFYAVITVIIRLVAKVFKKSSKSTPAPAKAKVKAAPKKENTYTSQFSK